MSEKIEAGAQVVLAHTSAMQSKLIGWSSKLLKDDVADASEMKVSGQVAVLAPALLKSQTEHVVPLKTRGHVC
jgi:hypothetical protein